MKSSTVWRKVSLLLCVITILCCFCNGDTACDKFTQCHLIYPDDNIRCSVRERGNCNSADSCYGIDSMLHSCHCNGEGLTLNLTESNGRDSFTCTRSATWDEEFSKLSCTAKPCDAEIHRNNSLLLTPDQTLYANGTEVTFRCEKGFELRRHKRSVVCNHGNWSSYPYCTAKPCDAEIHRNNSLLLTPNQTSYANGTEVTFRCEKGFELRRHTHSVVCNHGNWSSYPYCTVRNCSRPIFSDKHVRVSPDQKSYVNGSEVNFKCSDGFDLSTGKNSTICLYGSWEHYTEPKCRIVFSGKVTPKPQKDFHSNGAKVNFSYHWLLILLLVACGFLTAGFFAVVYFKHRYHRTGSMLIKTEPTLEVPSDNQQTYISKLNFEMSDPKDGYKNDYSSTSPNDNNEAIADVTNDDTLP